MLRKHEQCLSGVRATGQAAGQAAKTTLFAAGSRVRSRTKRRRRLCSNKSARLRQSERLYQDSRELWADAFFLVFEVHVHIATGRRLLADRLRPAFDVRALIPFVAQPKVCVVRGEL